MGRWGYQMFQGDTDLDIVSDIEHEMGCELYEKDNEETKAAREKLDSGLSTELMKKYRDKKLANEWLQTPEYMACVLAACMMHLGAKLDQEDRQYLKSALREMDGAVGYRWALNDQGFRAHGKVQFQAALENYVDGQPRNFFENCCANCGKISADLNGEKLKRCIRCGESSGMYCNRECQRQNWRAHKVICHDANAETGSIKWMNV